MKDNSNKFMMILAIVIIVATILGIIFYILYDKTDFGKSKEALFKKYIVKNLDYFGEILEFSEDKEYIKKLTNEDFKENTTIKAISDNEEYTFEIQTKKNIEENKFYSDINISCDNEAVARIEFLNKDNKYAIRLSDIVKQFVAIKDENISEFMRNMGIENEISVNKFNSVDITDCFEFSEEEQKELLKTYYGLVFQNLKKSNYSSQGNKLITLSNGASVTTKAYILTLNQNEMDNLEKRVLNQLSQDEIILAKLDILDNKIKEMGFEEISIKQDFLDSIAEKLDTYEYTGQNDITYKATVYVIKGETVRTTIEYNDKKIVLDVNGSNMNLKYNTIVNDEEIVKTYDINRNSNEDGQEAVIIYSNGKQQYEVTRKLKTNGVDINLIYNDQEKEILNLSINKNTEFVKESIQVEDEEKIIVLNDYTPSEALGLIKNLNSRMNEHLNKVQETVDGYMIKQSMDRINNFVSLMEQKQQNNQNAEIVSFNSQFELYKGEDVKSSTVLELLKVACVNMREYRVNGNQVRLYLESGTDNSGKLEEVTARIDTKLTYIVSLGYNDNGCIETVTLIPNERN